MVGSQNGLALNRIKAVLAEKRLTARWLATEMGKSENTVSRWCSNRAQPSLPQLNEISQILQIDVRELLSSNNKLKM